MCIRDCCWAILANDGKMGENPMGISRANDDKTKVMLPHGTFGVVLEFLFLQ
jgi:hypothetical protein